MRFAFRLIIACSLLVAAAGLAAAQHDEPAQPAAGHAPAAHTADQHDAHGPPKPALLQFDPGAAVWTIAVFVLLLVVLRAFAWKPILRALNQREAFIEKSIDDAKRERAEAKKLLADYKAQIDKARQEASAIVAEGRRDAEVLARRMQDDARREAEEMVRRARREIQLATDSARKELHDEVAELSVRIAGNIIRKELSADEHRALVAESLRQMSATQAERN